MTTNRTFLFPGGFAAVLTCLVVLTGCPGPMPGTDTGIPPAPDSGMPPDDGGIDPPDSDVPPPDSGMDTGTDAGMMGECTPDMMSMRVTPPCDPDTRTGAGTGPTGMEGLVGPETGWATSAGSCSSGTGNDEMGRVGMSMACNETRDIEPHHGVFYYDLDGLWYANWQNRATQESARMSFDGTRSLATIELFHAGEATPYMTVLAGR